MGTSASLHAAKHFKEITPSTGKCAEKINPRSLYAELIKRMSATFYADRIAKRKDSSILFG